jgi:hypothetical protein
MVSDLKNGTLPENNLLRKRFDAALIKKIGVIRTPYSFWPADSKINPPAKQLLWAAILLHDSDGFRLIEAVISTELEEKLKAKGQTDRIQIITVKAQQLMQSYIDEFIELAPNETFKVNLRHLAEEFSPAH